MTHTMLLVEDEPDLREMLRDLFELNGFEVKAAAEGTEALALLQGVEHLCLVVLDLVMPGMNGWDFLQAMRASPALQQTPVIVATSLPSRAPGDVSAVMRKPVDTSKLIALAHKYCAA